MLDVVEAIDGEVRINRCISSTEKACSCAVEPDKCKTHAELKRINEMLRKELEKVSIDQLI